MKTKRIGIFIEIEHSTRRETIRGLIRHASKAFRWEFDLHWPPDYRWRERLKGHFDGLIAWPQKESHVEFLETFRRPLVCIGAIGSPRHPRIDYDNVKVGKMAAEYFIERGIKQLGVLIGDNHTSYRQQRYEGFRLEAEKRNIPCELFCYFVLSHEHHDWNHFKKRISQWLKEAPGTCGLLVDTDFAGMSVLRIAREIEADVPDQLAVLGVGADDLMCSISVPPLSSVVLPGEELGRNAAQLMEKCLNGKKMTPQVCIIDPLRIDERGSSNVQATDDKLVVRTLQFIKEHESHAISIQDILSNIPLSRRSLEIRFKNAVGRSLQKEIWRVHIEKAKKLLASTSFPMPDIAEQSGFIDAQRLSEVFKRETGVSPMSYRKKHRSQA